jgi:sugar phosphate isomerase/epimerase
MGKVSIAAARSGGSGEGGVKFSVFSGVLPELSAEEVCARLARHGYDGVEWRVNGEYHWRAATVDRDAARIKELCAAHGLAVAGLTSYVRPDQEAAVARLIDACRTLGCPRFRIFSARYDPAVGYFAIRDRTRVQLERLARRLEGTGVKALLEIHFGTIVASPTLAFELLRDIDPATIGVILDPANLVIEGAMDLRMGLDMLGDRVDLVHVKNIRWEQTAQGRWRWRFDELADGQCDWAETIAALQAAGYDGWLSLENLWRVPVRHTGYVDEDLADASLPPRDIDQRLKDELAYLRRLCGQIA